MTETRCLVCRNKVRGPQVDAALAAGMSGAAIARDHSNSGWQVSSEVINKHREHYTVPVPAGVALQRKDLAVLVRDKTVEAVEKGILDIENENWKNVGPGLAAQKLLDTRANKTDDRKVALAVAAMLAGGSPAGLLAPPAVMIEDGNTIPGEFTELPSE